MRTFFALTVVFFATHVSAGAQEWNAFSRCAARDIPAAFSEQEREWFTERFCNQDEVVEIRQAFGVDSLRRAAGGARGVRVTIMEGRAYVDRFGHYVLMVEAIEGRGHPRLTIRATTPNRAAGRRRADLSSEAWESIAQEAAELAAAPGVMPDNSNDSESVCLHPMQVIVETVGFDAPRTLYTDLCRAGPAFNFGATLMEIAADAFPECEAMTRSGPDPWRMRACVRGGAASRP